MSSRTYLAVPYEDIQDASRFGASWDKNAKAWYVEGDTIPDALSKYDPSREHDTDPRIPFGQFLRDHDVKLDGSPMMDGHWHRVTIEGDKRSNASYRGFDDGGLPNGQLKLFKGGEVLSWTAKDHRPISREQRAALDAQAALKREERQADLEQRQDQAARTAFGIWKNAGEWANKRNSAYLHRKGIKGYGLKVTEDGRVMVPLRDRTGRLHNLQFIGDNKFYLEDGRKTGLFHTIDPEKKLEDKKPEFTVIVEGYATGASVYEATKLPTIVAFDSGNLKAVAETIRDEFPDTNILIAGDNDHHLENRPEGNVGKTKAMEAAKVVEAKVILPPLSQQEKAKGLTDWNDLHQERGDKGLLSALRDAFRGLSAGKSKNHELEHGNGRELERAL